MILSYEEHKMLKESIITEDNIISDIIYLIQSNGHISEELLDEYINNILYEHEYIREDDIYQCILKYEDLFELDYDNSGNDILLLSDYGYNLLNEANIPIQPQFKRVGGIQNRITDFIKGKEVDVTPRRGIKAGIAGLGHGVKDVASTLVTKGADAWKAQSKAKVDAIKQQSKLAKKTQRHNERMAKIKAGRDVGIAQYSKIDGKWNVDPMAHKEYNDPSSE